MRPRGPGNEDGFARFLPTYIVVGGWPWCDWGCVIILANEKRIFK